MNNQPPTPSSNGHHPQPSGTDAQQLLTRTAIPDPPPPSSSSTPPRPFSPPITTCENPEWHNKLLILTNAERSQNKLPPLNHNSLLEKSAQRHAEDMASHNFCDHKGSNGSSLEERVQDVGFLYSLIGENVAAGSRTPEEVFERWMNSKGHRANILNPDFTEIGLGYAYNPSSKYRHHWVQNFGKGNGEITSNPTINDKPDCWEYTAVGVLSIFYLTSLTSTYISTHLLLSLLSGGVGITIPIFGMQIAITDAVALMGTGILEGASLSDAYLEHKKTLTGSRKWASRGGRFLAFIGQGLLYYMALGQLLFATADVSSLGAQGLENRETSTHTEAALILEPPTPLHGTFVGTLSFAWSYGTTYIGPNALLVAIAALRRKRLQKAQTNQGSDDSLAKKYGEQQADVKPLLDYWRDQIGKEIQIQRQKELMGQYIEELKMLQRVIDRGLVDIANLPEELRRHGLGIAQNTPTELYKLAGITPQQGESLFKQPKSNVLQPDTDPIPPTMPSDWKQTK